MHAQPDLREPIGKLKIGRRGEGRITTNDDEHVHESGVDVARELPQRFDVFSRTCFDGIQVDNGFTGIAQCLVDGMSQSVQGSRLLVAGERKAGAPVALKIADQGVEPRRRGLWCTAGLRHAADSQPLADNVSKPLDFSGRQWEPVVRHRACYRRRTFDDVETVHPVLSGLRLPACGEFPRISQPRGIPRKEIAIERDNHIRSVESTLYIDVGSESQP